MPPSVCSLCVYYAVALEVIPSACVVVVTAKISEPAHDPMSEIASLAASFAALENAAAHVGLLRVTSFGSSIVFTSW
jgi:hypothetical protein